MPGYQVMRSQSISAYIQLLKQKLEETTMERSTIARFGVVAGVLLVLCWVTQSWLSASPETAPIAVQEAKSPQKRAEALGIKFEKLKPSYLNWCNRSGKMLYTCGFSSKTKGTLGKDMTTKQFAGLLSRPTTFVIGAADGLDPAIRSKA